MDSKDSKLQLVIDELGGFFVQLLFEFVSTEPVVGLLNYKLPQLMQLRQSHLEERDSHQCRPQLVIGAFGFLASYLKKIINL